MALAALAGTVSYTWDNLQDMYLVPAGGWPGMPVDTLTVPEDGVNGSYSVHMVRVSEVACVAVRCSAAHHGW